jgi:hypothetical protein
MKSTRCNLHVRIFSTAHSLNSSCYYSFDEEFKWDKTNLSSDILLGALDKRNMAITGYIILCNENV